MVRVISPRGDFNEEESKVILTGEDITITTGGYKTRADSGDLKAEIYFRSAMKDQGLVAVVKNKTGSQTPKFWTPLETTWREGNAKASAESRKVIDAYEIQIDEGEEVQAEININDSYSLRDLAEFTGQAPVLLVSMPSDFEWLNDNALQINNGTFEFQPAPSWTAKLDHNGSDLIVRPGQNFTAANGIVMLVALQHDLDSGEVEIWGGDMEDPVIAPAFAYSDNVQYSYMTEVEAFDGASTHVLKIYQINDDIETPEDESGYAIFGTLSDQTTDSGVYEGEDPGSVGNLMRFANYDTLEEAQAAAATQLAAWDASIAMTEEIQLLDEKGYEIETFTRGGNSYTLGFVRNTAEGERRYSLKYGTNVVASFAAINDDAAKIAAPSHADEYNAELKRQADARKKKNGDGNKYLVWGLIAAGAIIVGFVIYRRIRDGGE